MKKTALSLLFLLIMLLAACSSNKTETNSSFENEILKQYPELKNKPMAVTVVKRVVDGDTFETKLGAKVRFIGVNTPETVKPGSPVEKYGKEASDFTKSKLTGKTVYMYADVSDRDKYDRLLRYVFVEGDPVMFNETLIREGYANTMTVPPNVMFQQKFLKLEREARNAKKGLWADDK